MERLSADSTNLTLLRHFIGGDSYVTNHVHRGPLIDFLIERYPEGACVRTWVNGQEVQAEDLDVSVDETDSIVMALDVPNEPISVGVFLGVSATATTTAFVVGSIAIAAFNVVISMLLQSIFPGPKARRAAGKVYDINGYQNSLALGAPIPEHFGSLWFVPSIAAQPYAFYASDSAQWLYQTLLVGEGQYQVEETRVGSTKLENLAAGLMEVHYVTPAQHGSRLGYLRKTYGIWEDVVSNPEVQGIDLANDGQDVFFGRAYADHDYYKSKESATNFPVGTQVYVLGKDKNYRNHGVQSTVSGFILGTANMRLAASVINDAGNPTYQIIKGTPENRWRGWFEVCPAHKTTSKLEVDISFPQGLYWLDDDGDYRQGIVELRIQIQAIDSAGVPTGAVVEHVRVYTSASNNPLRRSESFNVASGRYRVRVKREYSDDSNNREVSNVLWTGLKAYCDYVDGTPAYGNVTLMVTKAKGSAALSGESASRITVRATRILNGVPTKNPVDAFSYIAGANADAASLPAIKAKWANTKGFNYRFEDETTRFEALSIIAASHRARVLTVGQYVSMKLDRPQATDKALFTKQSILKDTFSTALSLGPEKVNDGIRVEIQADNGMHKLFFTYPANAARPRDQKLYGITDNETALRHAKYLHIKTSTLRRTVSFETEFDALVARAGDRVAVLHEMTEWVSSARVVAVAGNVLTLDRESPIQGTVKVRVRDEYGKPTDALDGSISGYALTLASASPVAVHDHLGGQEGTTVVIGSDASLRKSYLITEIQPNETSVGVSAISYVEAPYDPAFGIPGEAP